MIFARLAKKQSKAGELGKTNNQFFEDWKAVDVDIVVNPTGEAKKEN